jgi:4'-phosphopantetheinyl transferase
MPAPTVLWWVDVGGSQGPLADLDASHDLLTPAERETLTAERRVIRTALRVALHAMAGADVAREPLAREARGRRFLAGNADIHFSISHTGGRAALALSRHGPIGIDIEAVRPLHLSPARRAAILDSAQRHGCLAPLDLTADGAFLDVWTQLEAIAKARGDGIGPVLAELGGRQPGATTATNEVSGLLPAMAKIMRLTLPEPGFYGALVCNRQTVPGQLHRLPAGLPALLPLIGMTPPN